MTIELINTGTELMLGRVLNTHQQWLCRQLADRGYPVARQVAVADTANDIRQAVRESLGRADLVLTTGGLGPTSDDLTRTLVAQLLGRELGEDAAIVRHIESFFAVRRRPMPPSTRVQALVPEDAEVFVNAHGTAPGLAMKLDPNAWRPGGARSWLIMLPGPPRELHPMFLSQVVPWLKREWPLPSAPSSVLLKTTGIGESTVEERIGPWLRPLTERGLEVGYCSRVGEVEIRLAHAGPGGADVVARAEEIARNEIGQFVYGTGDDVLEAVVVRLLTERRETVAVAESCTGGLIGHRLTNVPGASAVFVAGLVTYSNAAKQSFLGVHPATLDSHGAVSEQTVSEMAEGARVRTGATYALAVTGIAGPAGGSPEKPVGTVFIGMASADQTMAKRLLNPWDRETFKHVTAQQALDLLRRRLQGVS